MKLMMLTRNKSHDVKLFFIEEWNKNQKILNVQKWETITIIPAKWSMIEHDPDIWPTGVKFIWVVD